MDWAEDRLEELKRLWVEEVLTSTQIAERMGISQGTVLGKINRLGLLRHLAGSPSPTFSEGAEKPPEPRKPVPSQAPRPLPTSPSAADFEVLESHVSSEIINHPTIFGLRAGQCRFPLGGPREPARFFCGKPAEASRPYCRECCLRAYVMSPPRRR
jgi:GcrA cell cycle regulator